MKSNPRLIALSVAALALAACGGKQPANGGTASPPPLASIVVHAQQGGSEQAWDGVVEAVHQVTITAQTNARVTALPHEVGDVVARGAVLVRFSDVEQKSARNAAQAQIASAEATYKDAQASFERIAAVYAKGYVSTAQMDQQRAARDAAKAALESARAQLGAVGQALDYTVLRAPFAGIVTRRFVHVGEAVQAGPPSPQPLIQLQALDDLRVNVQVPQSVVDAIRQHHSAEVRWGGDAAQAVAASSVEVFPYADPATHTFNVRLGLPAGGAGLYPGMTVKVGFATGEATRLLVPVAAVVQRGELVGVYVVDDHGVVLRQVRTGNRDGDQVEVLAGLDDGERVASDPQAALAYLEKRHAEGAPTHE
ncbi:MAG: efflux RND transporter periplasmic adaptor subunit [Pseudomonadota bacterium]|jgi:RND family efflux transporter MFP subunit|nr:efflux RND transporter periplasmic adaptor subunit [Xanthomonadaceae bacterium]MDE2247427.1 efflux RND transporter periplasmic adaptor subunit [Xanthomonadaceae bacterium]MDE3210950.1 efflux RND transporter periplasmic adaptor subunit [Pseudomonadota bacterium]